jgi:hypothetical protein
MNAATQSFPPGGGARIAQVSEQLTARTIVNTTDVQLTFFVRDTARAQPLRFIAVLTRNGTRAGVSWQLW